MKRIFVKREYIADNNFSEIDFDLYEEFGFSYDTHDDFKIIGDGKRGSADAEPIQIDRMIEALQELKKLGSTHVQLEYHCDHIGYDISGYRMRLAEQSEIDEVLAKELAHREKMNKIGELRKQIEDLNKN